MQHTLGSSAAIAVIVALLAEAPVLVGGLHLLRAGYPLHSAPVQHPKPEVRLPHATLPALETHELHPFAVRSATIFLYGLTFCIGLAAVVLLVYCVFDAALHWCHRAHFHSCQKKVQQVHEVFLKRKGELPLCPYCIESISSQSSPHKVVFLCGHRFHTDCANKWFQSHPRESGRCPICEVASDGQVTAATEGKEVDKEKEQAPEVAVDSKRVAFSGNTSTDEAQSFILDSLHRRYPDIITKACVERWASCHTEIWLQELARPRYNSILQTK
mmetsp:Transcript_55350/g.113004  ORF Transcript_55350/g.113004 Transcript_55350/m.113004 type:complete len:272 (-) Transcript_55350:146-961(-)